MSFLFSYSYRMSVMTGMKVGGSLCIVFYRLSLLVLMYGPIPVLLFKETSNFSMVTMKNDE